MSFSLYFQNIISIAGLVSLFAVVVSFMAKLTIGESAVTRIKVRSILWQILLTTILCAFLLVTYLVSHTYFFAGENASLAFICYGINTLIVVVAGFVFGPIAGFSTTFVAVLVMFIYPATQGLLNSLNIAYAIATLLIGVGSTFYAYYLTKEDNAIVKRLDLAWFVRNGALDSIACLVYGAIVAVIQILALLLGGLSNVINTLYVVLELLVPLFIVDVFGLWFAIYVFRRNGNMNYHYSAGNQINMNKWFAKRTYVYDDDVEYEDDEDDEYVGVKYDYQEKEYIDDVYYHKHEESKELQVEEQVEQSVENEPTFEDQLNEELFDFVDEDLSSYNKED